MNLISNTRMAALALTLLGACNSPLLAHTVTPEDVHGHERRDISCYTQAIHDRQGRLSEANDNFDDDSADAALLSDGTVFEDVGIFEGRMYYTELFRIETGGAYRALLTDFAFPTPLKRAGINITTATGSLGTLFQPGFLTFKASPGNYYVSFFGKARSLGQYGISISRVSSPVPIPAAAWLFGSGLLGLAGVLRRNRRPA